MRGESLPGYVLLITFVLLIALISTSVLNVGQNGVTQSDYEESSIYWRAARPIAIVKTEPLQNGSVIFSVRNKDYFPVAIIAFSAGGKREYFSRPIPLEPGEGAEFAIELPPSGRSGALCEFDEVTFGLSRGGTDFFQSGSRTLVMPCPASSFECVQDGSSCNSGSRCCSGLCSSQGLVCASCLSSADACQSDSECCQSPQAQVCRGGRCSSCIPKGKGQCSSPSECCGALLCSSQTGECLSCLPAANLCSSDSECCGGLSCARGRCQPSR